MERKPNTLEEAIEHAVLKDKVQVRTHTGKANENTNGPTPMEINQAEGRRRRYDGCFACGGKHRLRDCKDPRAEAKRKEIDDYNAKKKSGKGQGR